METYTPLVDLRMSILLVLLFVKTTHIVGAADYTPSLDKRPNEKKKILLLKLF